LILNQHIAKQTVHLRTTPSDDSDPQGIRGFLCGDRDPVDQDIEHIAGVFSVERRDRDRISGA
jgi:hypothetical protein